MPMMKRASLLKGKALDTTTTRVHVAFAFACLESNPI